MSYIQPKQLIDHLLHLLNKHVNQNPNPNATISIISTLKLIAMANHARPRPSHGLLRC